MKREVGLNKDEALADKEDIQLPEEIEFHLKRYRELIADADPAKLIRPFSQLYESFVYEQCFTFICEDEDDAISPSFADITLDVGQWIH